VFGDLALVQRCQQPKRQNILDHLPKILQASLKRTLCEAWDEPCAALAERRLTALARSLEYEHPGAAASLREGLEETLTVTRLGLSGALRRSLRTTNLIESLNSSIETYTHNVKRWRGGAMAQRWVSAALLDAEKRLRRVRGYRDLPRLVTALEARSPGVPETERVA
jgi:transposase-like protein